MDQHGRHPDRGLPVRPRLEILADLGDDAIRIQAETFARLVSGQIAETIGPAAGQDPLAHYLRVVTDKTAR